MFFLVESMSKVVLQTVQPQQTTLRLLPARGSLIKAGAAVNEATAPSMGSSHAVEASSSSSPSYGTVRLLAKCVAHEVGKAEVPANSMSWCPHQTVILLSLMGW